MVAVITINYNLSQHTVECVKSVLSSDCDHIRIFLVDNGSREDDFQSLSEAFSFNDKVQLLRIEKNQGYVGGVNHGLAAAADMNPDYYLVMNNDTIMDRLAIKALVKTALTHENKAIISGKVYYYDHPEVLQHTGVIFTDKKYLTTLYPGRNEIDAGQHNEEKERDSLDDVFWLIPAKVFQATGYYNNYFYLYAEQGDYAWRARKAGFKLIYTPEAKIWHKESMTAGDGNPSSLRVYYWRGQGLFISQYLHLRKKYFIILMIKSFARYILKAVFSGGYARRSNFALLRGYAYGFFWMFNKRPNNGWNPYLKRT